MGTHRNTLNVRVVRSIGDDSIPQITSLRYAPDIDVISFLDESMYKMKQLIDGIIEKEADLKYILD